MNKCFILLICLLIALVGCRYEGPGPVVGNSTNYVNSSSVGHDLIIGKRQNSQLLQSVQGANHEMKGLADYKAFQYSDKELKNVRDDELVVIARDLQYVDSLLGEVKTLGYRIVGVVHDSIIVKIPEKGPKSLKRHQKIINALEKVLVVDPSVNTRTDGYGYCTPDLEVSNDSLLCYQWALNAIQAPQAWKMSQTKSSNITIAVCDTGVNGYHPDLIQKGVATWCSG